MSSGELAQSIWTWWTAYWVATTWCADKYQSIFLLLLLYLITVACILEISSGLCWHKDEWMGQRSTLNHNVQLFISLNNQCAIIMIIQWPSVEMYTCKLCPNQISITIGWLHSRSIGHIHQYSWSQSSGTGRHTDPPLQSFVCSFNWSSINVSEIPQENHFCQADSNHFAKF